jgi:hypothetical protein
MTTTKQPFRHKLPKISHHHPHKTLPHQYQHKNFAKDIKKMGDIMQKSGYCRNEKVVKNSLTNSTKPKIVSINLY